MDEGAEARGLFPSSPWQREATVDNRDIISQDTFVEELFLSTSQTPPAPCLDGFAVAFVGCQRSRGVLNCALRCCKQPKHLSPLLQHSTSLFHLRQTLTASETGWVYNRVTIESCIETDGRIPTGLERAGCVRVCSSQ